jgi:hypothetical protein
MGLHWALPLSAALLRLSGLPEAALGELSASAPWNGTGKMGKTWGKLGKIMGEMGKTRENHGKNGKNWGIVEELGKKMRKCCEKSWDNGKGCGNFSEFLMETLGTHWD